ncbi:RNA 2'-phosphotransferase [Roseimaritima ulvae]|uniref:RNA 2'-phosphotransferase n=1 Tax=Roseimaritima ulvae TaxID=980254 RepID=A0A5B9QVL3_9BACT|nr:RNA 2'-phosphotransferase [Roseimaritima ulvae]QEG41136.1 RNA 2'-phosphotransferase [Roseimaritima ulvae]
MNKRLTRISKYLTFVLRHHPESIGMQLEPYGWLNVEQLVENANAHGKSITVERVHEVIAAQETPLFELSDDQQRIRAL